MKFHIVKLYEIMLIYIKLHKFIYNNQKHMSRTTVVRYSISTKDNLNII